MPAFEFYFDGKTRTVSAEIKDDMVWQGGVMFPGVAQPDLSMLEGLPPDAAIYLAEVVAYNVNEGGGHLQPDDGRIHLKSVGWVCWHYHPETEASSGNDAGYVAADAAGAERADSDSHSSQGAA